MAYASPLVKLATGIALAVCLTAGAVLSAGDVAKPKEMKWPFDGMTGHIDKQSAQRGYQVYQQVCAACHSLQLVSYRSLSELGFSEAEIKAIAAEKEVQELDEKGSGELVMRKARPSDKFVPPYANEDAARAANGGSYPPDLSLITKAREHGPDYVYSLMTGYTSPPADVTPVPNKYYNPYFPTHFISMPPPLTNDIVTYQDGTPATMDQMAHDVVVFLQWAAEPETTVRKQMGVKVLVFLFIMSVFFYFAKRRIWKDAGH